MTTDKELRTGILAALANVWLTIHSEDDRKQSAKLAEAARNMRGPWFKGVSGAALKTAREIVSREAKDHVAVEACERFTRLMDQIAAVLGLTQSFRYAVHQINEEPVGNAMGILQSLPVSPLE